MLVLISFGLVLVATVLLVLGLLVGDGLALIYVSIACSLAAGVVLVIATRMARPQAQATGGPAPLDEPATTATPAAAPPPTPEPEPERTAPTPVVEAPAPARTVAPAPVVADDEPEDDDDFFPIADYDDLTVSEITPLLPQLYADELEVVEERERAGKSRATILGRIAELREQLAGAPADVTAAELSASGAGEWGIPEEGWDGDDEGFPIPGYDDLTVAQITDEIDRLSDDELEQVREREEAGKDRKGVLRAIDDLLEPAPSAARKTPAARKTSAARKPAKKKTAKKTARKTAAKKSASKKAPAKRSASKKSASKKSGTKKAASKKAASKKATKKR